MTCEPNRIYHLEDRRDHTVRASKGGKRVRKGWFGLVTLLALVLLAAGCRRPAVTEAELIAQQRERVAHHLAERYAGLVIDRLELSQVDAQNATFTASTELLARECSFQVDIKSGAVSDDLGERVQELFARRVWNELHGRHQMVARMESCQVRSGEELEFGLRCDYPQLGASVPFTLTLTANGSTDNLLAQLQTQAAELASRHLQVAYPSAYRAETIGAPRSVGGSLSVAARAQFMGEAVEFQVEVHPGGVVDNFCQAVSAADWFSRATVWAYDGERGSAGSEAILGGRKLAFLDLQDGWVRVSAGASGGGLLPLWYLTQSKAEVIASHAPVTHAIPRGARFYATPEAAAECVAESRAVQLVQISAAYNGYSYGRCQLAAEEDPIAGWIPTSELQPLGEQAPALVGELFSHVAQQTEAYLQRYSLFQAQASGEPSLDGGVASVSCRLHAFGQEIAFRLSYDGLYRDDLASGLARLVVYPRLSLHPAQDGSTLFAPGAALQVQGLAGGDSIGIWPGSDLPWVLVKRDRLSGWLPMAYLTLQPADHYPQVQPYEMIVAHEADVLFFPGSGDRVQPLSVGRVVQVSAQSDSYLYVRYSAGEAAPWAGGWMSRTDLQAFDENLSRECLLAKGAVVFEFEPNNSDAQWVNDLVRSALILKEANGWVLVGAPGGLVGWTEEKNLISRNPWRQP